ncbi:MAG: hypothetical protein K6E71_01015 [Lachnospiraceae bacterium]|nr:hypothetical protein [Lachnospiraceae bacterium]
MKRIVFIVFLVMLIILTACGGDDDGSDESIVNEKTPTITSNQRPEEVSIKYDLYNRELLHEIDSESFGTLQYVVGEGFYLWHNKSMYIRATDFWNKDLSKLISLE